MNVMCLLRLASELANVDLMHMVDFWYFFTRERIFVTFVYFPAHHPPSKSGQFLTHCRLNRFYHTIYWKSPISIIGTSSYEIKMFLEKNG